MGCIKSKEKKLPAPRPLSSNSRQEWISWRNAFLTYMTQTSVPHYKQGDDFFHYIGNVGSDISENFYYPTSLSEAEIDTILFKFDVYFTFGGRKRHAGESIEDYVAALKDVAEKTAKRNTDKVIKEKILQDLVSEKAFEHFVNVAPSFTKIMNYESLALHELLFIWEECIKLTSGKSDAKSLKDQNGASDLCPHCGKCGSDHIRDEKCPAFGKECSLCRKTGHFAWQCFTEMTISCDFCGQSHVYNRLKCPAKDSRCNNCNRVGHYSVKCRKNIQKKK